MNSVMIQDDLSSIKHDKHVRLVVIFAFVLLSPVLQRFAIAALPVFLQDRHNLTFC
jgi:hypothetical protein